MEKNLLFIVACVFLTQVSANCKFQQELPIQGSFNIKLPIYPLPFVSFKEQIYCSWELVAPSNVISVTIDCPRFNVFSSNNCFEDSFSIFGSSNRYCGQGTLEYKVNSNVFKASYFSSYGRYPTLDCFVYVSEFYGEETTSSTTSSTTQQTIKFPSSSTPSTTTITTTITTTSNSFQEDSCKCGRRQESRIIAGVETGVHEYPWQAVIYGSDGHHSCGGTLIGSRWVLTAGHCVDSKTTDITIRLGEHHIGFLNDTDATVHLSVVNVILQPSYVISAVPDNDIAILELSSSIDYTKDIHPICLPYNYEISLPQEVTVTGWGTTSFHGETSQYLQKVTIPLISNSDCTASYGDLFNPETMICAFEQGKDSCQGDSGGPLLVEKEDGRSTNVGIVSWGNGCGSNPGVYTRVTKYLSWIEETIGSSEICIP